MGPTVEQLLAKLDPRDAAGMREMIGEARRLPSNGAFTDEHREALRDAKRRGQAAHDATGKLVGMR